MTRAKYKALRTKLYKSAGELGTLAEGMPENRLLSAAYRDMTKALDDIDLLGEKLGFIDPMTNDFTDRRFKKGQREPVGHFETEGL